MKKMIYQKDRIIDLLYQNNYLSLDYYIFNLGTHPTAYIKLNNEMNLSLENINNLKVHGGITFTNSHLIGINSTCDDYFIGWDYAHLGDYQPLGFEIMLFKNTDFENKKDRKYTTKEIDIECKYVIMQIIKIIKNL